MIPLDLSATGHRLIPSTDDSKALPSPLKASPQSEQLDSSSWEQLAQQLTPPSSSLHRTLRTANRHSAGRNTSRRCNSVSSWCVVLSGRVGRRRTTAHRHCAIPHDQTVSHTTARVPTQFVECSDDTTDTSSSAAHSNGQAATPRWSSRGTTPPFPACHAVPSSGSVTSTEQALPLPSDPRAWTRDNVHAWLRDMSDRHNMDAIDTARFMMNGKALCLMDLKMFKYRVPVGGEYLHYDFQTRLRRAFHAAATAVTVSSR